MRGRGPGHERSTTAHAAEWAQRQPGTCRRVRRRRWTALSPGAAVCGICGEIRFDGAPADVGAVARMTDAMGQRGPDAHGLWQAGGRALGHRRLAIIDLSDAAAQPMVDVEL